MEPDKKGWITTPGAIGHDIELDKDIAFPVDLPIKILSVTDNQAIVTEPRGKVLSFSLNDISEDVAEDSIWDAEWDRHSNPARHRWDLVEIIKQHGSQVITDWECGPYPHKEFRDFFQDVFEACKLFEKEDNPEFNNALIDLTLLMFGEVDDQNRYTYDVIEMAAYAISQLLTCRMYTKSGIDWSSLNKEEWLNDLKPYIDDETV
jgi:hypothetical protein